MPSGRFRSETWTENPRVGGSIPPLAIIPIGVIPATQVTRGLTLVALSSSAAL
jgi:hypothetical protein